MVGARREPAGMLLQHATYTIKIPFCVRVSSRLVSAQYRGSHSFNQSFIQLVMQSVSQPGREVGRGVVEYI